MYFGKYFCLVGSFLDIHLHLVFCYVCEIMQIFKIGNNMNICKPEDSLTYQHSFYLLGPLTEQCVQGLKFEIKLKC